MNPPKCNCGPCRSRRAAQQRWVNKNREKKRAINRRALQTLRTRRRAELAASVAEVSDEELDRRALGVAS